MDNNKKYEISIFGSCVTRDLLEYNKSIFDLKTYVARQSIVSSVSKPIVCNLDDIKLKSNFKKNQVYGDLVKNTFERLKNDGSKFLLIDLIDERFQLIKYENTILTYSSELMESDFMHDIKLLSRVNNKVNSKILNFFNKFNRKKPIYIINNVELDCFIDEFIDKILDIYNSENIIVHKAKMLDFYKDTSGAIKQFNRNYLINNKKINDLLEYMYTYMSNKIPNAKVIDLCDDYVADENHKWGLAPMHYQEEYYLMALNYLIKYLG